VGEQPLSISIKDGPGALQLLTTTQWNALVEDCDVSVCVCVCVFVCVCACECECKMYIFGKLCIISYSDQFTFTFFRVHSLIFFMC
jgi:hypothetical protein